MGGASNGDTAVSRINAAAAAAGRGEGRLLKPLANM